MPQPLCKLQRRVVRPLLGALLLAATLGSPIWADSHLDALEQALFSSTFPQDNNTQRLDRLEQRVFGEVQIGTDTTRTTRLQGALKSLMLHQATNPSNTGQRPIDEQNVPTDLPLSPSPAPAPPDATDYPTVTALERQVFGRDFIREDIQDRLSRLEKKVYNQARPQLPLADRVDSLLARYPNLATASTSTAPDVIKTRPASGSRNPVLESLPDDPRQFSSNQRDIYSKLDALEQHYFNGRSTPNALITERLDRLERTAYGQTFSGQSVDARVSRLLNPYQSNRAPVTGDPNPSLSRPGFQARQPYPSPSGATGIPPAQNIQIGGGFSSNSSYSFSPEMMSMLPPNVRAQMGSNTAIGSPSTVVIDGQGNGSTGNNGFQTYGGPPIQQYNYYSNPDGTVTQRQSTTVIQPYGGQTTMETIAPSGYPVPYYVGDPAFLQSLNQLEINVFKQANTVEPVPIRLGRLESSLLGQVYTSLPEQQRLENLEKTYRLQAVSKLLGQSKGAHLGRGVGSFILGVPLNSPNPLNPMGIPQPLPVNPGVFGR